MIKLGADEQELIDCLRQARSELLCLGRDLMEIDSGQRIQPTCLLDPEIIERIDEALAPFARRNKAAQQLGRKGGKAKTPAQAKARAANLASARKNRWPERSIKC